MFLEKHDRLDYSAASSLWLLFLPVKHMVADTHCQSKKEKDPPPLPQKHITKLLRERRWTCENLIISNLWKHENITTRVHKKCRLLVLFICSFSTGGKGEEAGKRSRRVNRRSCRKKRGKEEKREETESWQKRERGGSTEEPSCDSHPTSMHRWECYKYHWYHQSHCLISNKSNFMQTFTEAIQFYTAFYTAVTFFARHFQIIIIKFPMTDVKTSSYFSGFFSLFCWQWFFQQDSGHLTVHRQTYRQTQIYRADTKR